MNLRYQRQIILPGFGEEAQQKLRDSKVLVIGAGGLGCPVLQSLSAAGVGCLGIVDFDTVSLTNLHRQTLFSEKDLGRKKVEVSREKLFALNSELKYETYDFAIQPSNAIELIQKYDVVIDCTDDLGTRYLVNDVCAWWKKPLVYASIFRTEGQVSVFHFGEEPRNLRDLFPEIPNRDSVISCGESGVLGVLTSLVGNFQANEAIKIIIGQEAVLSGEILIYNHLKNHFQKIQFPQRNDIFIPHNKTEILKNNSNFNCVNVKQINSLVDLKEVLKLKNSVIIDVRNEDEIPEVKNENIKRIPLQELERNLSEMEKNEHLIFLCQSGVRSMSAVKLVQSKFSNKKLYNIKNGVSIFQT